MTLYFYMSNVIIWISELTPVFSDPVMTLSQVIFSVYCSGNSPLWGWESSIISSQNSDPLRFELMVPFQSKWPFGGLLGRFYLQSVHTGHVFILTSCLCLCLKVHNTPELLLWCHWSKVHSHYQYRCQQLMLSHKMILAGGAYLTSLIFNSVAC